MFFVRHVRGTKKGDVESFDLDLVRVGRDPESELRFDPVRDGEVSSRHAQIYRENGSWAIDDLDSTNGTFVNSKRIAIPTVLSEGDVIELSSRGPKLIFSTVEPKVGGTVVISDDKPGPSGIGSKTVSMMISDAMREVKSSRGGRFGSTAVFMREMLHQASNHSSKRLRFALVCAGILLAFIILGLVVVNVRKARILDIQGDLVRRQQEQLDAQIVEQKRAAATLEQQRKETDQLRARSEEQAAELKRVTDLLKAIKDGNLNARMTENGVVADLPNVLFAFNSANLTDDGRQKLQHLASVLAKTKDVPSIEIEGHASREGDGSDERNQQLSEERADAVAEILVGGGIPRSHIQTRGYGSSRPLSPGSNDTEAGRQQNRRVEVLIGGTKLDLTADVMRQLQ